MGWLIAAAVALYGMAASGGGKQKRNTNDGNRL